MTDLLILAQSAAFKLTFALVAVAMLLGTLRLLDYICGITFGEILEELREAKGTAVALYFGLRILAIALLIGAALG